jgi:response regulator NasT
MTTMKAMRSGTARLSPAMLVDRDPRRRADYAALLADNAWRVVALPSAAGLAAAAAREKPDFLIVVATPPDAGLLAEIKNLEEQSPLPVVMISAQDGDEIGRAITAGVHAFGTVEPGSEKALGELRFLIDTARANFAKLQVIGKERDNAVEALAERKIIERAKGIVMSREGVTEDEAYRTLRKAAMNQNRKLIDVARKINEA